MSIFDRFRLTGKRLFITGGSRGLGREMVLACAEAGADIAVVGRDAESLAKTSADIQALGRSPFIIQADVSKTDECEAACNRALEEFGPIDILINNAGGRRQNIPTAEMPLETWRELIDLNLTSVFICTKILGGAMLARGKGGRIINVASINALVAGKKIGGRHYETAKAGVVQFTRATAADWAQYGITVNAILPGGFMTEPNQRWKSLHPEVIEEFLKQIPMGNFGQPEDLGPLAVYLASDASRYMTGASLVIDGGYTLW
ncbi:MAG: SDR family oxidoreductase [Gemmataceae bacterium]|nr:SDR family oxidoreductase [Gemmataceae bacterium]